MIKYIIIVVTLQIIVSCHKSESSIEKRDEALKISGDSCSGYRIINNKVYYFNEQIVGADPHSFECIKYEYSKDSKSVFFNIKKIEGSDPETFKVLKHGYSRDKKFVYFDFYSGKKTSSADTKTFEVFSIDITKDINFVYRLNEVGELEKIVGVDAKSLKKYKDYYVDKTYLYNISCERIARLDTINIKSLLDDQ